MKFACLGHIDEERWSAMSEDERDAIVEKCLSYDDELVASGNWVDGGQAHQNAGTAKTLRWKNGKVVVTDGPFAECRVAVVVRPY